MFITKKKNSEKHTEKTRYYPMKKIVHYTILKVFAGNGSMLCY